MNGSPAQFLHNTGLFDLPWYGVCFFAGQRLFVSLPSDLMMQNKQGKLAVDLRLKIGLSMNKRSD